VSFLLYIVAPHPICFLGGLAAFNTDHAGKLPKY
jgi:hypothetical protein